MGPSIVLIGGSTLGVRFHVKEAAGCELLVYTYSTLLLHRERLPFGVSAIGEWSMSTKPQTKMTRNGGLVPLGFAGLHVSVGDHLAHFYETDEEEKMVLVSFLVAGLEAGEKCICLVSAGPRRQALEDALMAAGVDLENTAESGQLTFDDGKSHPEELRHMLGEALADIPGKFPLLRWAGVMSWGFKKIPTTEKLMEWETHCNIVHDPAAVFLCQYELPAFGGSVVMDAMKTHPICIVSGAIHQNPYYEKPDLYMEELRGRASTALA